MTTLREKFAAARISEASLLAHLEAERIKVGGVRVTDPDTPIPDGVDFGIYVASDDVDPDAVAAELAEIRARTSAANN